MKTTEQKTIMVPLTYWACCNDKHRHKTQRVAQKCIDRRSDWSPRKWPNKTEKMKRAIAISRLVLEGKTFKTAGENFGLSGSRARDLFRWVARQSAHYDPEYIKAVEQWRADGAAIGQHPAFVLHHWYDVKIMREKKKHWMGLIDKLEADRAHEEI